MIILSFERIYRGKRPKALRGFSNEKNWWLNCYLECILKSITRELFLVSQWCAGSPPRASELRRAAIQGVRSLVPTESHGPAGSRRDWQIERCELLEQRMANALFDTVHRTASRHTSIQPDTLTLYAGLDMYQRYPQEGPQCNQAGTLVSSPAQRCHQAPGIEH